MSKQKWHSVAVSGICWKCLLLPYKLTQMMIFSHLIHVPRFSPLTGGIPGGIGGGSWLCPVADGGRYPLFKLGAIAMTEGGGGASR